MKDFIEELKENQKINYKYNLEDRIDMKYVIKRLEDIKKDLLENAYYFNFHNKNLTKTQDEKINNIIENLTNKGGY